MIVNIKYGACLYNLDKQYVFKHILPFCESYHNIIESDRFIFYCNFIFLNVKTKNFGNRTKAYLPEIAKCFFIQYNIVLYIYKNIFSGEHILLPNIVNKI